MLPYLNLLELGLREANLAPQVKINWLQVKRSYLRRRRERERDDLGGDRHGDAAKLLRLQANAT